MAEIRDVVNKAKRLLMGETFVKGDRVIYTPAYGKEGYGHGVVCSTSDKFVFVKYDNAELKMVTGDEPYTPQATNKEDLVLE